MHVRTRFLAVLSIIFSQSASAHILGGVDLGNLTNYHMVFTDGNEKANWQGATKGFVGDVAANGTPLATAANLTTSGTVPYAGTIYTNASTLGAWQNIVSAPVNAGQAFGVTGEVARLSGLNSDLTSAFSQIDALTATAGFTSVVSTALNGLNTQNSVAETYVINVTSGFSVSSQINITGDASDIFILRWDSNLLISGYQGEVKFQSGGAIVPLGGLTPGNFIHTAGDISSSGGGSNPAALQDYLDEIDAINGGTAVNGGGFFTGYWLTTGDPVTRRTAQFGVDPLGETGSLSNAIFVGGWYTNTTLFSMTSGTSGVYVPPVPEPAGAALLAIAATGLLARRRPQ